jgi:Domain of unknown function (DUF5134)
VEGRDDDHVHHLSHYLTHLVMACSMLYMYLAAPRAAPGASGGMAMGAATGSTTDFVGVPLLFVVVLFASGIWELDGIERFAPQRPVALTPVGGQPVAATGRAGGSGTTAPAPEVGTRPRGDAGRWVAPRLEAGCHIAMCVTMGFMLVLML